MTGDWKILVTSRVSRGGWLTRHDLEELSVERVVRVEILEHPVHNAHLEFQHYYLFKSADGLHANEFGRLLTDSRPESALFDVIIFMSLHDRFSSRLRLLLFMHQTRHHILDLRVRFLRQL